MNYKSLLTVIVTLPAFILHAQQKVATDSTIAKVLNPITVLGYSNDQHHLPDVLGMNILAGKKTDAITLRGSEANLPQNIGRMIFAKIPGINLWDMDGAGTQMNIGTRGTDAHRSIEMNMRQNGYNTNSDIFGYPENHYTVPMQGVKQVQLIRGSASLQFGSQFGGMMNYVMKEGDSTKVFSLESEQTLGSYNMFNSFNAVGGKKSKVSYYAYFDNRHGDGWRPNSDFNYKTYYTSIKYQFNKRGSLTFQFSRMNYRQQIAGGLTDAQFKNDARLSGRARNYFSPIINVPAIIFHYEFTSKTRIEITANGVQGERSSVQFINNPDIADTINTTIGTYNPRQVDRDFYKSFTAEARLLHHYNMGRIRSTLAGGIRYFNGETKRRQKGKGTTGSDFDFTLMGPYGIDLKFHTTNAAIFAENIFQLGERLSITPGFRYEVIQSNLTGVINKATFPVSYKGKRTFPLFGTGIQYLINKESQLYGNITQAYRPFLYASVTPADQLGIIDPNLKDSKGYSADLGYRGHFSKVVTFDISGYYFFYGDKIGKLLMKNPDNSTYLYTTNIGNSVAKGIESYINVSLLNLITTGSRNADIRVFNSLAYTHARYKNAVINIGSDNPSLKGKHVEGVPDWVIRTGLELRYKGFGTTLQMSHTSKSYNDANNTVFTASGVSGQIPAYTLWDLSTQWNFLKQYHVSAGVNNLTDLRYFSRRINMYPGPGILSGDGRTFYISVGFKI